MREIIKLNLSCNVTAEYRTDKCVSGIFIKLDRKNIDVAAFESYLAEAAKVQMRNYTIYTITNFDGGKLYVGTDGEFLEIGSSVIERKDSRK